MKDSEGSIFSESLNRHQHVKDFCEKNIELNEFLNLCLNVSWAITSKIIESNKENKELLWPSLMLQTLHGYFRNSLIFLMSNSLDEGMAILRMAAELTRDIKCIFENPNLSDLWLKRDDDDLKRASYRKKFKFTNSVEGKAAFKAYKLICKFGVHGHLTSQIACKPESTLLNDEYVVLKVTDEGVFQNIRIWIASLMYLYSYVFDWNKLPKTSEFEELHKYFFSLMRTGEKYVSNS
ncbi:MAG TPA: hypothetical protein VMW72_07670 [Sedimentisphaerales bacterium]|nr:hypothetical protein [Sedimentisphaerales bacterium]